MEKEKKIQIIRAAAKRFDRHGLNKTTLDEVARDLRIGKASIYHYFKSKDDLYFAVLNWEGNRLLDEIKDILKKPETTIIDKLKEYLGAKENLRQRFKILDDTIIHILSETSFENEINFFSDFTLKEEEIVLQFITENVKNKSENVQSIASIIILQSWNIFFAGRLNVGSSEKLSVLKEEFIKLFEGKII